MIIKLLGAQNRSPQKENTIRTRAVTTRKKEALASINTSRNHDMDFFGVRMRALDPHYPKIKEKYTCLRLRGRHTHTKFKS